MLSDQLWKSTAQQLRRSEEEENFETRERTEQEEKKLATHTGGMPVPFQDRSQDRKGPEQLEPSKISNLRCGREPSCWHLSLSPRSLFNIDRQTGRAGWLVPRSAGKGFVRPCRCRGRRQPPVSPRIPTVLCWLLSITRTLLTSGTRTMTATAIGPRRTLCSCTDVVVASVASCYLTGPLLLYAKRLLPKKRRILHLLRCKIVSCCVIRVPCVERRDTKVIVYCCIEAILLPRASEEPVWSLRKQRSMYFQVCARRPTGYKN